MCYRGSSLFGAANLFVFQFEFKILRKTYSVGRILVATTTETKQQPNRKVKRINDTLFAHKHKHTHWTVRLANQIGR